MAYESKMIVVNKSDTKGLWEGTEDLFMCEEIASIKLGRIDDDVLQKIFDYPNTDCYICYKDNFTARDSYGDMMKEIPIKDAVKIFSYASAVHEYRRYEPCASLLRGFNPSEWDNLVVLHFGY